MCKMDSELEWVEIESGGQIAEKENTKRSKARNMDTIIFRKCITNGHFTIS